MLSEGRGGGSMDCKSRVDFKKKISQSEYLTIQPEILTFRATRRRRRMSLPASPGYGREIPTLELKK